MIIKEPSSRVINFNMKTLLVRDGAINPTTGEVDLTDKVVVKAKTAIYQILAAETGTAFTNEGAAARQDFNLPPAVAGLRYELFVQDVDGIRVIAATGDTIRIGASVSAAAGRIDATAIGSSIVLTAINATEWIASARELTWTVT